MPADERFSGPGPDEVWRSNLAAGAICLQCCDDCSAFRFPPALACPKCGSARFGWKQASGRATVYSATTVRERDGGYNVSIVELAEGPRMMTRVEEIDAAEVRIGMSVTARIAGGEEPHLVFVPDAQVRP
jgi:uncharacterized OB-fold protein